jgi:hypothetical protein
MVIVSGPFVKVLVQTAVLGMPEPPNVAADKAWRPPGQLGVIGPANAVPRMPTTSIAAMKRTFRNFLVMSAIDPFVRDATMESVKLGAQSLAAVCNCVKTTTCATRA